MAACGAKTEEAKTEAADDVNLVLPGNLKEMLAKVLKANYAQSDKFDEKGVAGTIGKASVAGFTGAWVKSDKVYKGMKAADWTNYNKFLAETTLCDKTIKAAENVKKNDDGTVSQLYAEMKMGTMISNRDVHSSIVIYKCPEDCAPADDMKCGEVTVWTDVDPTVKPSPKKVVRMKITSFCFMMETADGYRTIDFDNYDFGGKLPAKITNKFVGNKADYISIQGYMENIKKNGGKFVK